MPAAKPVKPSSKDKFHTKHIPGPAASKLTTLGIGGKPKIFPWSSVTTHWVLLPVLPDKPIAPAGILSAVPSTQNSNGPPVKVPPAALHTGVFGTSILSKVIVPMLGIEPLTNNGPPVIILIAAIGLVA